MPASDTHFLPEALGQGIATWHSAQGVLLMGGVVESFRKHYQALHKMILVSVGSQLSSQLMGGLKSLCPLEH